MRDNGILSRLERLERPIRVGLAGAGEFGAQIVGQTVPMRNVELCAIGDADTRAGRKAFRTAGFADGDIVLVDGPAAGRRELERGRRLVTENPFVLTELPLDVLCDATGDPAFGVEFAYRAIEAGQHVIMVNVEADMLAGAMLRRLADRAGVVYSLADGDQPSLIVGLWSWARSIGLEVVAAGKWTHVVPETARRSEGRKTEVSYDDGSKNQAEMCCVANCTGLLPDRRGMHMPSLALKEVAGAFRERAKGGLFASRGVVDVINCVAPDGRVVEPLLGGGVFVTVACANPLFSHVLGHKSVLSSADGEVALLYRPFHLVGVEAPASILRAALYREATAAPLPVPVSDVVAVAKRDLAAGERLDGIGGKTVRGEIERYSVAAAGDLLPYGLAHDVTLDRPVLKGTTLTYGMLAPGKTSFAWRLRRLMDAAVAPELPR